MPEEVVMDNESQFDPNAFRRFSKEHQYDHITSSQYHPRSNGEDEQGVKTVKALLKKGDEPYLVLLAYRSTPLSKGYLPTELLMNRKLRTNVLEKLGNLMFQIGSLWLKRRRSRDRSRKPILIDVTGLGICCQHFLEIWYGYQTGGNREL